VTRLRSLVGYHIPYSDIIMDFALEMSLHSS
jgi:hypothetical protein